MARPMSLSTSGVSTSNVAPLCHFVSPFNVSVDTVVTGTVVYSLQYTNDNVQAANYNPATGDWKNHPMMTGSAISDFVEFTAPAVAVRINQTSGAGSVVARVTQAGL